MNVLGISDGRPYSHSGATIAGKAAEDELGLKTVTNMAGNPAKMLKK